MPKSSLVKKATTMTMTKEEAMAMTMVGVAIMMQAMKAERKPVGGKFVRLIFQPCWRWATRHV